MRRRTKADAPSTACFDGAGKSLRFGQPHVIPSRRFSAKLSVLFAVPLPWSVPLHMSTLARSTLHARLDPLIL
jgi:hypothetical protein